MMDFELVPRVALVASTAVALAVFASPATGLQTVASSDGPTDSKKVLVLDFQTLNQSVNKESTGELSRIATEAARMFRERMQEDGRYTLVTMEEFQDARTSLQSSDPSCAESSCAREAARSVGVTEVFRGRVIKVSNLIWYVVVEHADVESGKVLGQESIELKGQRDVILPRAVAALHRWLLPAG